MKTKRVLKTDATNGVVTTTNKKRVNLMGTIRSIFFENRDFYLTHGDVVTLLKREGITPSPSRVAACLHILSGNATYIVSSKRSDAIIREKISEDVQTESTHGNTKWVYKFNARGKQSGKPALLNVQYNNVTKATYVNKKFPV